MTVEEAETIASAARKAFDSVERERRDARDKAIAEVDKLFADRMTVSRAALAEAERAVIAAKDQASDHPWTGNRVFMMKRVGRSWERSPPVRIEGVVETYRSTTVLPLNTASYRRPQIGEGFVRLLKKDGSRGAAFERMWRDTWKLAEGSSAGDQQGAERAETPAKSATCAKTPTYKGS